MSDFSGHSHIVAVTPENEDQFKGGREPPNGDPPGNGIDGRVSALETHMSYVRKDLDGIQADQKTILGTLAQLATKRDLETFRWQWIATGFVIIAMIVGGIIGGLDWIKTF